MGGGKTCFNGNYLWITNFLEWRNILIKLLKIVNDNKCYGTSQRKDNIKLFNSNGVFTFFILSVKTFKNILMEQLKYSNWW